ncbi:Mobile element protein [Enhygromyxa salina]|uniref:Mobile element protein n=1 Tax=Enhygromyxa salina TaxID=215803 RepID=A0A0C2D839_9BACT|nr:transposase [Enhygromyxa salina]KIG19281.1 Mobile element protein [Enhygromyxa salina]
MTIDMSAAYIKAVAEAAPNATIIFDRFHVQKLANEATDEVRRDEVREAEPEDKKALKNTRWQLLKSPWNLTDLEDKKLADLPKTNERIYRGYLLKETLVAILECSSIVIAEWKLDEWDAWASRSRLTPFVKLAKTIRRHRFLAKNFGDQFDRDTVDRIVRRGTDGWSITGMAVLGLLYDQHFTQVASLTLPEHFLTTGCSHVAFYCALREHCPQRSTYSFIGGPGDFRFGGLRFDFPDDWSGFANKMANQGPSAIIQWLVKDDA